MTPANKAVRELHPVIGIDGGGTKTAAVILDQRGQILGCGESGPSTYGVVPSAITKASIAEAVRIASEAAGLATMAFAAAFLGLGNVVSERDRAAVQEIAAGLGLAQKDRVTVDHDIRVALAGGLSGRPGMVLIAGTGTSCFGVNSAGESWRAGGWGPLIDDEGSSYWLGIQAMRAAVRDFDRRAAPTLLRSLVTERLALADMNDLMNRLYAAEMTRTEIAALAPLVFAAAAQSDETAARVIRQGCEAMADCALAVAQRIGFNAGSSELAVTGGLTNAGEALLVPLREAVRLRLPRCQVKQAELRPSIGAALLALAMTGKTIDRQVLARVRASGRELGLIDQKSIP